MRVWIALAAWAVVGLAGCSAGNSVSSATSAPIAPVAYAGASYSGVVGTAMSFTGSGSMDAQGQTLTYAWSFGDGATGTGLTVTHTYAAVGTFTATLTVTDTSGLSGKATAGVTVGPGLAGTSISGTVYSGTQPVAGAHVYLFAANTTGYGGAGIAASATNASVSLLSAANTGLSDSVGAYVLTGAGGGYSLAKQYTCAAGQQVYLYVLGGNSGAGTNAATGLMAALGTCPTSSVTATVNEVTTVAAAYALAGFATDATHVSSSGTPLALVGIANAFANAGNLASLATGAALATTPAGTGTVPQAEINTLANVLAGCTTTGNCTTLLATATVNGLAIGAPATDTGSVAINVAHYPGPNVGVLYGLARNAVFSPALSAQPNDWTMGINITGGGLIAPLAIAIDGAGNAWVPNAESAGAIEKISSAGVFLSGTRGFPAASDGPISSIAIDPNGSAWALAGPTASLVSVIELSNSGTLLSGASGFETDMAARGITIDGGGDVWTGSVGGEPVELSNAGTVIGVATAGGSGGSYALDGTGNLWTVGASGLTKLSSTGALLSSIGPPSTPVDIQALAVDGAGAVWAVGGGGSIQSPFTIIGKYPNSGTQTPLSLLYFLPNLTGYSGVAIDGAGNAWFSNLSGTKSLNSLTEVSNFGVLLSPNTFEGGGMWGAGGAAVDGAGDIWVPNFYGNSVTEFIGAAVPVVTPLSVGVKMNMLGTRP